MIRKDSKGGVHDVTERWRVEEGRRACLSSESGERAAAQHLTNSCTLVSLIDTSLSLLYNIHMSRFAAIRIKEAYKVVGE